MTFSIRWKLWMFSLCYFIADMTCFPNIVSHRYGNSNTHLKSWTKSLSTSTRLTSRPVSTVCNNDQDMIEKTTKSKNQLFKLWKQIFIIVSSFTISQSVYAETTWDSPETTAMISTLTSTSTSTSSLSTKKETNPSLSPASTNIRYWDAMQSNSLPLIQAANEKLLDFCVGTINTMYYDNTGGARFNNADMFDRWKTLKAYNKEAEAVKIKTNQKMKENDLPKDIFLNRDGAVKGLKYLVSTLNDPYSVYLTREELRAEFSTESQSDGFLGLGMIVESKRPQSSSTFQSIDTNNKSPNNSRSTIKKSSNIIPNTRADNLPIVVAVKPNSPAERSGIVVGDRIAAVGTHKFIGLTQEDVSKELKTKYNAENYAGYPELSIAKPIYETFNNDKEQNSINLSTEKITKYKLSRVRIPTTSLQPFQVYKPVSMKNESPIDESTHPLLNSQVSMISGGNSICYYELLTPNDSIFSSIYSKNDFNPSTTNQEDQDLDHDHDHDLVGYIRLTRFSRTSTSGYVEAVQALEKAGASSYIIDLRNNYGGVIQEAMLTASTLLRDPSTVLCYTINSRGGFTPHDVEEYVVDSRYPGYLLSSENPDVTLGQVRKTNPNIFRDGEWLPPSQFASLHEQGVKRGVKRPSTIYDDVDVQTLRKQKRLVLLINEGTASSAEVFASSLHDNGRTVGLVGAKTYGKGLIQHTFPMPDGGGLRLTVAEYLTPALQHVTKVGGAKYNPITGEMVGGGVKPDIYCESEGIPSNPGADICVGIALDVLNDSKTKEEQQMDYLGNMAPIERSGGTNGGFGKRRVVHAGVVKDDF